ncbi:MAG: hypothetical protein WD875_03280 [Pirellulales bacterium]
MPPRLPFERFGRATDTRPLYVAHPYAALPCAEESIMIRCLPISSTDRTGRPARTPAACFVVASFAAMVLSAVAVVAMLGGLGGTNPAWAKAQDREAHSDTADKNDAAERAGAADRVREGTRWQQERGVFTLVGDRVTFTNQRKQNFVVLENLNLERVVRTIEENRTVTDADTLEWNIDATVTEFRGVNFILVTRSVLVARPRGTDTGH